MSNAPRHSCWLKRTTLVALVFLTAGYASFAAEKTAFTIADNGTYKVVISVTKHQRLELEVSGPDRKTLWASTPSSAQVTVSLPHERIMILDKVRNPGIMELHGSGATSGGKIFDLRGKEIGTLDAEVIGGWLVGGCFLGRKAGATGLIGYDVVTGKELWRDDDLKAEDVSAGGVTTASLRSSSDGGKTIENTIIDTRSGRALLKLTGTRAEDPLLLAHQDNLFVTLRTERAGETWRWRSKIVNTNKKEVGDILWPGHSMPYAVTLSADDKVVAAVCVLPAQDAKNSAGEKKSEPPHFEGVVSTFSGKVLVRRELGFLNPGQAYTDYEPHLELRHGSLTIKLTRRYPPITWKQREDQEEGKE